MESEAVTALDQHAGAELTGRGAHARHDWRRQRNLERRHRIVETLHVVQTGFAWIIREQAGGHQNIEELGAFVDLTGYTVLNRYLPSSCFTAA